MFINSKQYVYYMQTLELLGAGKKAKLLEGLLFRANAEIKIRNLANKLKINPGYLSVFVKRLKKEGLIKNGRIAIEEPRIRALKILLNVDRLRGALPRLNKSFLGIGIYGSWAKGTNTENSDLDVWIKVSEEPAVQKLSEIRRILREVTGAVEVSIVVLSKERVENIRAKDPVFYSSLLNSFHLRGEFID